MRGNIWNRRKDRKLQSVVEKPEGDLAKKGRRGCESWLCSDCMFYPKLCRHQRDGMRAVTAIGTTDENLLGSEFPL